MIFYQTKIKKLPETNYSEVRKHALFILNQIKKRTKRIKYFSCAVDLIKNSKIAPTSKESANNKNEILHRFAGKTKNKEPFFVQIKEDKKNDKKYFMSCFSKQ